MRYHFIHIPTSMATSKKKNQIIPSVGEDVKKWEFSYIDGENIKWGGVSLEGSLIASLKSKQKFTM